jgi:hypothetical protein
MSAPKDQSHGSARGETRREIAIEPQGKVLFVLPDANQQHAGRLTLAADGSHQLHNYKSTSYASSLLVFSSLLATRRLEALPPRTNTLLIRPSPSPGLHQARSASLPEEGEREMAMRDSCGDAKGHVKRTRATWETRHLNTIHPYPIPTPLLGPFSRREERGAAYQPVQAIWTRRRSTPGLFGRWFDCVRLLQLLGTS